MKNNTKPNRDITDRRVVYKRVRVAVPHCNVCDEQLGGNGGIAQPYKCSCGVWKFKWEVGSFTHRYDIKT